MSKDSWNKVAQQHNSIQFLEGDICRQYILFPTLDDLLKDSKKGAALDIGCGTGLFVDRLSNMGFEATGFDFSEGMVETAKDRYSENAYYVHDLADGIKAEDDSHALVTSILVFHNISEDTFESSIKEIHRVLEDGGRLLTVLPHPVYLSEFENLIGVNHSKYLSPQKANYIWKNGSTVSTEFYLRPLSYYMNALSNIGLKVNQVIEPRLIDGAEDHFPDDFPRKKEFPGFLILECVK